jgi:hypothetical protein
VGWRQGPGNDQDNLVNDFNQVDEAGANNCNSVNEIVVAKKTPKRRKIFGRSQKRGGDRKLGDGGEGLEYAPPVAATWVAVSDAQVRKLSIRYISKKNLLHQLQQMEVNCFLSFALIFVWCIKLTVNHSIHQTQCQLAQGQVLRHSAKLNSVQSENRYLANLAQEHRRDLIREESKWIQVVAGVEARAHQTVNKALTSVLDAEVEA